jgi:hypothetical protein
MNDNALNERLTERLRQLEKGFANLVGVKITGITSEAIRRQIVAVLGKQTGIDDHLPASGWLGRDLKILSRIFPGNIRYRRTKNLNVWDLLIPPGGFKKTQMQDAGKLIVCCGLLQSVWQKRDGSTEVNIRCKTVDVAHLYARIKTLPPLNVELREFAKES